jgi:4-hydroxymandelate oxidase
VRAEPSQQDGDLTGSAKAEVSAAPLCLTDFEPLAKAKIPSMGWEYMSAGAADELTLKWNTEAYQRLRLRPRILVDVSHLDTSIVLLGRRHSVPIVLAPVASHKLYHPEGEIATVRGASAADVTLAVTTPANTSLEDVAAAAKTPLWFQVYVQRDSRVMQNA